MTSPILVMIFYSLLNFQYLNLIPRWSPQNMYYQTIDLDTLLQGPLLPSYSDFFGSKHRAHQRERWPSPAWDCPSGVYKNFAFLSRCPFAELKHSQPSNFRDWLRTVSGMESNHTAPHFWTRNLQHSEHIILQSSKYRPTGILFVS